LVPFDDDGDVAAALTVSEHLVEERGVGLDVLVADLPPFGGEGLTGLLRVGSAGFAEDDDGIGHGRLLLP